MSEQAAAQRRRTEVEVRLPADGAFVSVLRTTTAGLAARLDFTIDEIEDLRIAVGEAIAMLLPEAAEDADLTCTFRLDPGRIEVAASVPAAEGADGPDYDSFAWQVLSTLADEADAALVDGTVTVTLAMTASLSESPA